MAASTLLPLLQRGADVAICVAETAPGSLCAGSCQHSVQMRSDRLYALVPFQIRLTHACIKAVC